MSKLKRHRRFASRRVNRVNLRREYFYTTPAAVKVELADVAGNLLEFNEQADAEQYHSSELIRTDELATRLLSTIHIPGRTSRSDVTKSWQDGGQPRIVWSMSEQDALDVLGTLSMVHRRLDGAKRSPRSPDYVGDRIGLRPRNADQLTRFLLCLAGSGQIQSTQSLQQEDDQRRHPGHEVIGSFRRGGYFVGLEVSDLEGVSGISQLAHLTVDRFPKRYRLDPVSMW